MIQKVDDHLREQVKLIGQLEDKFCSSKLMLCLVWLCSLYI